MNAKQREFCEEYVKVYNASRAYHTVYGLENIKQCSSAAARLMARQDVKDYIKVLQKEQLERFGDLAEVIANELAEDMLYRDENGKHNNTWQRSAELLQKQLGLQGQKLDVSSSNGISINILGESDEG